MLERIAYIGYIPHLKKYKVGYTFNLKQRCLQLKMKRVAVIECDVYNMTATRIEAALKDMECVKNEMLSERGLKQVETFCKQLRRFEYKITFFHIEMSTLTKKSFHDKSYQGWRSDSLYRLTKECNDF